MADDIAAQQADPNNEFTTKPEAVHGYIDAAADAAQKGDYKNAEIELVKASRQVRAVVDPSIQSALSAKIETSRAAIQSARNTAKSEAKAAPKSGEKPA